jgi:MFS family permease
LSLRLTDAVTATDPLNLPNRRKVTAIGVISFFGSLALSAEVIIGSLIPVFLLFYSGVDPKILNTTNFQQISGGSAAGVNPLAIIPEGVVPADIGKVSMLATIPLLSNGIASYLLVPLSIAIGRRPVLLFAGACAWAGGLWAGFSTSLDQHLAARAVQGLGAGAVEALIPLIIQDMVFIHQRNRAMSIIVSSQGIIITGLGTVAPYLASNYDWRWLYYITSGVGIIAWFLLIAFLPETRWIRTQAELSMSDASIFLVNLPIACCCSVIHCSCLLNQLFLFTHPPVIVNLPTSSCFLSSRPTSSCLLSSRLLFHVHPPTSSCSFTHLIL